MEYVGSSDCSESGMAGFVRISHRASFGSEWRLAGVLVSTTSGRQFNDARC